MSLLVRLIVFALAYLFCAELSYALLIEPGHFASFWPSAGVLLALLLAEPRHRWPLILAAASAANLVSDLWHQQTYVRSLGFLSINLIEPLLAAALLMWWCGSELSFHRVRNILSWSAVVLFSAAVGALGGAWLTRSATLEPFAQLWWAWWIGDLLGMLALTPLVYGLLNWRALPRTARVLEAGALLLGAGAGTAYLFSLPYVVTVPPAVLFLFLMWAAMRFGATLVAACMTVMTIIALRYTETSAGGPFLFQPTVQQRVQMAQILLIVGAFAFYLLGAVVAELRAAQSELQQNNLRLDAQVKTRTAELTTANQQLRENEARLQLALDASQAGVWSWDVATNIFQSDDRYHALYGFDGAAPRSLEMWLNAVCAADRSLLKARITRLCAAKEGSAWNQEFRIQHPVKGERWVLGLGWLERDPDGQPLRMTGLNLDITESKRAEQALRESEARFRRILKQSPAGIVETDANGKMVLVNERWCEMLGYTEAELLTMTVFDITHPNSLAATIEAVQGLANGGPDFQIDKHYRRKDGSILQASSNVAALRDNDGNFRGVIAVVLDLTERLKAEDALRESEERMRMVLAASNIGIWSLDFATDRIFWSREHYALFGTKTFDGTLAGFLRFVHPEDVEPLLARFDQAVKNHALYEAEFRIVRPDTGETRWITTRAQTEYDGEHKPLRMRGAVLDITERKQFELEREQLLVREQHARQLAEDANRAKDEWLAMVTHELRSPLNAMLGHARLLHMRRQQLSPDFFNFADLVRRNGERQNELINDLLDSARMLSGKLQLEPASLDLAAIIQESLSAIAPSAQAKDILLLPQLEPGVGAMMGDAARLQQMVLNLLTNAVKFTPPSGTIVVRLQHTAEQVVLTVQDTGKGITPDFLPHVFDRFSQSDTSRSRRHGGLGLGLALVKQIVELHGGTITAQSAGEGQGATFTVHLPIKSQPSERPQEGGAGRQNVRQNSLSLSAPLAGVKILVVDDDTETRALLATLLTQFGAEVRLAVDAAAAWDILTTTASLNLLLCDLAMPGEDGYSLLTRWRLHEREHALPRLPALALTALSGLNERLQVLRVGFQAHVTKPIEPEELLVVMQSLLNRSAVEKPEGAA